MNVSSIPSSPPGPNDGCGDGGGSRQPPHAATAVDNLPAQSTQTTSATDSTTKPKPEELDQAIKAVNEFVKPFNNALNFSVDQESKTTVVKVIDQSTKEVIRQIPSEEMLALAKALDTMKGLLIQQKA